MFASFRLSFFAACGVVMLGLSSCGEAEKPAAAAGSQAEAKPAASGAPVTEARYECPMGCAGSQSSKPGKCPVCEMELEKKS